MDILKVRPGPDSSLPCGQYLRPEIVPSAHSPPARTRTARHTRLGFTNAHVNAPLVLVTM